MERTMIAAPTVETTVETRMGERFGIGPGHRVCRLPFAAATTARWGAISQSATVAAMQSLRPGAAGFCNRNIFPATCLRLLRIIYFSQATMIQTPAKCRVQCSKEEITLILR